MTEVRPQLFRPEPEGRVEILAEHLEPRPELAGWRCAIEAGFGDGVERRQRLGIREPQRGRVGREWHARHERARQCQGPRGTVTRHFRDRELAEDDRAHQRGVGVERQDRVGRRQRVEASLLDRLDHVRQRRRRERPRPLREVTRDEVQDLRVVHERVVVRLVAIRCGALADPWNLLGFQALFPLSPAQEDSLRDQRLDELVQVMEQVFHLYARLSSEAAAPGEALLLEELIARRQVCGRQVRRPVLRILVVEPLAQAREHGRGHDPLPGQQIGGVGPGPCLRQILRRNGPELLQVRVALLDHVGGNVLVPLGGLEQEVHRVDRRELAGLHRRGPQAEATLGVLARAQHPNGIREVSARREPRPGRRQELGAARENHLWHRLAHELLRAQMAEGHEIGAEAMGENEREGRDGRFELPVLSVEVALHRHVDRAGEAAGGDDRVMRRRRAHGHVGVERRAVGS